MRTFSAICLAMILFMELSCQQQPATLTAAQKAEIEKQLREQWNVYLKAANGLDFNKMVTLYSDNQFLGYFGDARYALISCQAFRDSLQSWFNRRAQQKVESTLVTIHVLKPDIALLLYIGHFTTVGKTGKQHQYECAETFVFIKENVEWKIIHEHES